MGWGGRGENVVYFAKIKAKPRPGANLGGCTLDSTSLAPIHDF